MIRAMEERDLARVLHINQNARPALGDLDAHRLRELVGWAAHALVVDEGEVQAFVLALEPAQPYTSSNYLWLEARLDDHVYVDRIGVAEGARGRGLGSQLYAALRARAGDRRITCEVNTRPPNEGSIRFHRRHGFVGIGRQQTEGGKKEVLLMATVPPALPAGLTAL